MVVGDRDGGEKEVERRFGGGERARVVSGDVSVSCQFLISR